VVTAFEKLAVAVAPEELKRLVLRADQRMLILGLEHLDLALDAVVNERLAGLDRPGAS
jgi:hypothetical protein